MYTYFRPCGLWPLRTSWLLSPSANMDMKGWAFAPLAKAFQDLRIPGCLSVWLRFRDGCDKIYSSLVTSREITVILAKPHGHHANWNCSLPPSFPLSLSLTRLFPQQIGSLILTVSTLLHFLCKYVNIFDDFPSLKNSFIVLPSIYCDTPSAVAINLGFKCHLSPVSFSGRLNAANLRTFIVVTLCILELGGMRCLWKVCTF